jgi:hypothetical protein
LIESLNNGILSLKKHSINWLKRTDGFRRLTKIIIKSFDQLKSVKNFLQLIMKLSINWKMTILINWFSVKRPPFITFTKFLFCFALILFSRF